MLEYLINKIDIKEETITSLFKKSAFYSLIKSIKVPFVESLESENKVLVFLRKNIDNIQNFFILILLFSIIFASSEIIGVFVLLLFLTVLTRMLLFRDKPFFSSLDLPIILYMLIAFLSVLYSPLLAASFKGYSKTLTYFCSYLAFINIFKENKKNITFIFLALAILSGFEGVIGLLQKAGRVNSLATWQDLRVPEEFVLSRVYGTLQPFNPNLYAGWLVSIFPMSLAIGFINILKKRYWISFAMVSIFIISALAMIFSGSRGSYISLAVMMFFITIFSGRIILNDYKDNIRLKFLWFMAIFAGAFLFLVFVLSSDAILYRLISILAVRADSSNSFRMYVYAAALKIFLDNFWIGIGPGNQTFRLIYGLYMTTGYDALSAYSVPLEIALESGIFALLSFFWIIAMALLRGFKFIIRNNNIYDKILVSSCFISIAGLMAHGMFDTVFFRPQIQVMFLLNIAAIAVLTKKNEVS